MIQPIGTRIRVDFIMEEFHNNSRKVMKWENRVFAGTQLTKIYSIVTASALVIAIAILLTIDINRNYNGEEVHEYLFSVEINLTSHAMEAYFIMLTCVLLIRASMYYLAGNLMTKTKERSMPVIEFWISLTIFFVALESVIFIIVHDYIPEAQTLLAVFYVCDVIVQVSLLCASWGFALSVRNYVSPMMIQDCHELDIQSDSSSSDA